MSDDESLKDKLDKLIALNEKMVDKGEVKKWKIPFMSRVNNAQNKKNYVTVMTIKDNRSVDFIKVPITDGCIDVDGLPRMAISEYVLRYKNNPMIIQPSWSLKPFSAADNYEDSIKEQMNIAGRKLVLAKMKYEAIAPKKSFGGMGWIILVIAIGAAAWYLIKGGSLF